MSGVAGADRIKSRQDFAQFLKSYQDLISKFPGFKSMQPSGSYNSDPSKMDFGDIDLIVHITSDQDKAAVKKELQAFFTRMPDTVIVPFSSAKHVGKRTYNAGELVSVRYHDDVLGYSAQIDNIIALDQTEATFKQQFLDWAAEKQGLILGLVKVSTIETAPEVLFQKLGIKAPGSLEENQEYEFNLSSVELQLRKVTYTPGTFQQTGREVIWKSQNFDDLQKLLYQYDLNANFDSLLRQCQSNLKNPRSKDRIKGVFSSMITVKSGEIGTAKGAGKEAALAKINQALGEHRKSSVRLLNALMNSKLTESTSPLKTVVIIPGGFHPPHPGHLSLYNAAQKKFPGASIFYTATDDQKTRPFSFEAKKQLAALIGIPADHFIRVARQFNKDDVRAALGLSDTDLETTILVFARSEKDQSQPPFAGVAKKDGTPGYLQPLETTPRPMSQVGYVIYLPTIEFSIGVGGISSATEIRSAWPGADDQIKDQIVNKLYPKDPKTARNILDQYLGSSKQPSNKDADVSEKMLPPSAFAGWPKYKLGPAGQLKGSMKRPATAGDLVGGNESVDRKQVPISEDCERIISTLIDKIIINETVQNNRR